MFPTCKTVCPLPQCPCHPEPPHCQCSQVLGEEWNLKYVLVSLKVFGNKIMFLSLGFDFFFPKARWWWWRRYTVDSKNLPGGDCSPAPQNTSFIQMIQVVGVRAYLRLNGSGCHSRVSKLLVMTALRSTAPEWWTQKKCSPAAISCHL